MSRYIDADKLKEYISDLTATNGKECCKNTINSCLEKLFPQIIDDIPTANVREIKYAGDEDNE